MKRFSLLMIISICIGLSFSAGTIFGFTQGIYNFSMLSNITNGSLSANRLQLLQIEGQEEKHINFIKFNFEFDVDEAIWAYSEYDKKGNKLLSEQFLPGLYSAKEEYMNNIAKYRTTHPILYNPDQEWGESDAVFQNRRLERIKRTLREHGVPEGSLSTYATEYFK